MTTLFRDRFQGIIPPVISPLNEDGRFDVPSAERLYAFHVEAGVHGLFLFGSSGEGPLLSPADREAALKTAVRVVDGRIPILAGALTPGTEQTIQQGGVARDLGVDALVVAPPFYFAHTQKEIAAHFQSVKAAVDLPLVAYDIPVCVKTKIAAETMLQLARDGVIDGVKDSSGDLGTFRRVLQKRPDGFRMHTGSELLVDTVLSQGADGAVPGLANVDPKLFVELYESWRQGRDDQRRDIVETVLRLFEVFADFDGQVKPHVAVGAMKTAMMLRGVISTNRVCRPFTPVADAYVQRMRAVLSELELL